MQAKSAVESSGMTAPFAALTVPIDASAHSEFAIVAAIQYAQDFSVLHFCSVVEPMLIGAGALGAIVDTGLLIEGRESAATSLCEAAVATARAQGATADASVLYGMTADAVADFARTNSSDAILICTHARNGLARLALGSVTEDLLARSTVPVIVVHTDDAIHLSGPITLAYDGSPGAAAAQKVAQHISTALGRTLNTVHVENNHNVAAEIIARAQASGSGLIVMGTFGRSGLARVALGSVAAGVIERAKIPVVVVRSR